MAKLAIGAGHGGYGVTPGKRTPDGEYEWNFNDVVVDAAVKRAKEYGIDVLRLDDPSGRSDVSLNSRTYKANKWGADVLVSVHHNAYAGKWGNHSGTETFTYTGHQPGSTKLAKLVQPRLVKAYGLQDRGIKQANFHMLRESNMPAILTEGGYMDSTIDIKKMRDKKVLQAAGVAIADGVAAYFGYKLKDTPVYSQSPEDKGYLVKGDTGSAVKELQKDLNKLGYKLAVDGSFGPAVEKAVKGFQKGNNLAVDGSYGPNTQAKLAEAIKRLEQKPKEEKYMEKNIFVCNSDTDALNAYKACVRNNGVIKFRANAEKEKVYAEDNVYICGGGKGGIKVGSGKVVDLSGKNAEETSANIDKHFKLV